MGEIQGVGVQAWTAVAAAIVATATFVFSIWTRRASEAKAELQRWQRVVVYTVIDELGTASFEDIKQKYLQKAQQLLAREIPKKEIQDDALKLAILDLQKENTIIRNEFGRYGVKITFQFEPEAMEALMRMTRRDEVRIAIIKIVEKESDVYSLDSIARKVMELGVKASFQDIDSVMLDIRGLGHGSIRLGQNGKLVFVKPHSERYDSEGLSSA